LTERLTKCSSGNMWLTSTQEEKNG